MVLTHFVTDADAPPARQMLVGARFPILEKGCRFVPTVMSPGYQVTGYIHTAVVAQARFYLHG